MKLVNTPDAPAAIGPYSQGFITIGFFYSSGQVPLDPATGAVVGTTIEEQTEQVMKNLGALLKAAGASYENVVKTTCFLKDINDFAAFNAVYAEFFKENAPARSCVGGIDLPKGALCEIEVIAAV